MTESEELARDLLKMHSPEDALKYAGETLKDINTFLELIDSGLVNKGAGAYMHSELKLWENARYYLHLMDRTAKEEATKILNKIFYGEKDENV
jgi:hypothetical protein